MANNLTVNGLRAKWGGKDIWRSDGGARGAGRLLARIMQDGVAFYFQYFVPNQGKEVKRSFPLGEYDDGTLLLYAFFRAPSSRRHTRTLGQQ